MDEEREILPPVYSTDVFVCDLRFIHLTPLMKSRIHRVLHDMDPVLEKPIVSRIFFNQSATADGQYDAYRFIIKQRSALVLSASAFLYNHILMIFNDKFISIVVEQTQRFQLNGYTQRLLLSAGSL